MIQHRKKNMARYVAEVTNRPVAGVAFISVDIVQEFGCVPVAELAEALRAIAAEIEAG